jgi:hypothetical protein
MHTRSRLSHVLPRRKRTIGEIVDLLGTWFVMLALVIGIIIALVSLIELQANVDFPSGTQKPLVSSAVIGDITDCDGCGEGGS